MAGVARCIDLSLLPISHAGTIDRGKPSRRGMLQRGTHTPQPIGAMAQAAAP